MIIGYFPPINSGDSPPYFVGLIDIPEMGITDVEIQFLIDTGADRSLIGDDDSRRMVQDHQADFTTLEEGIPSQGIGGIVSTREAQAKLQLEDFSTDLEIDILEPVPGQQPTVPSLLGRDILSHFALFMEDRTDQVLLLEPAEADALRIA
jgi:hypothetical protein